MATVLTAIAAALSFGITLGVGYYLVMLTAFVALFFLGSYERKLFNRNFVLLLLACLVSIIFNQIPYYFQPYTRFAFFCVIIFMVSPLMISKTLVAFRFTLFKYINNINIGLCSLSYVGLVTGLYKGITINRYGTFRKDFTGFFNHSMLLGPMSGIAILTCVYYIYKTDNNRLKLFYGFCALLSFLSAVTAGSRGALIGLAFGYLFFLYKVNQGKITKYIASVFVIVLLLVASFPLWQERTSFLLSKMQESEDNEDAFYSRTAKWDQRVAEFSSSPVFGIGFAAIDPKGQDYFDKEKGTIEPGSGWLGILSMTGILGLLPVIAIFYSSLKFLYKDQRDKPYLAFLGALVVLFFIHMFIEGYVFASGALLCFYIWLMFGIIEGKKHMVKTPKQ